MSKHYADAVWRGNLKEGKGHYTLNSSGFQDSYTFHSRFEDGDKSSPDELIGAALASCFSMALAHDLDQNGASPKEIHTNAEVVLTKTGDGHTITDIFLTTKGKVTGIEHGEFQKLAEAARKNCPVGKALEAVNIRLEAELV